MLFIINRNINNRYYDLSLFKWKKYIHIITNKPSYYFAKFLCGREPSEELFMILYIVTCIPESQQLIIITKYANNIYHWRSWPFSKLFSNKDGYLTVSSCDIQSIWIKRTQELKSSFKNCLIQSLSCSRYNLSEFSFIVLSFLCWPHHTSKLILQSGNCFMSTDTHHSLDDECVC
jgi:hypothetical protein